MNVFTHSEIPSFQSQVLDWSNECFGEVLNANKTIRNHRFFEEAVELVQAVGCTKDEVLQIVDYVFDRPIGEPTQEVGGVIISLYAFCNAHHIDGDLARDLEFARVLTKVNEIREKNKLKPVFVSGKDIE